MDLDGLLPFVLPIAAACAARPLSERLPPRTATWLLTVMALGLAASGAVALTAPWADRALRVLDGAPLGALWPQAVDRTGPVEILVALVTGAAAAVSLVAAVCAAVRQARALRAARRSARALPGGGVLAVIDDDAVDAFALPGRPGRVVVSTGMLAVLDPGERRALLAHEHSHLDGRHHLFRAVTSVAVAANPLLWPFKGAVRYTTERWADEYAASVVGDRRQAARAIGKAALAHGRRPGPGHATGLGIGSRVGPVPRRVAALLRPAPPRRAGLASISVLLLVSAVVTAPDGAADLEQAMDHTGARTSIGSPAAAHPGASGHFATGGPRPPGSPPPGDAVG
jgi:Zn-dependent protease with chaperone function